MRNSDPQVLVPVTLRSVIPVV